MGESRVVNILRGISREKEIDRMKTEIVKACILDVSLSKKYNLCMEICPVCKEKLNACICCPE
jgi:hypothetical protein